MTSIKTTEKRNTTEMNCEKGIFMKFSSSECATWLAVGLTESAVIIAGTLISIILFERGQLSSQKELILGYELDSR